MRAVRTLPASLFFPLALGCAWGSAEALAGPLLRDAPFGQAAGSLLAGSSLLFLAAGWVFRPRPSTFLLLPLPAVCALLLSAGLRGTACTSPTVLNPATAFLLEAAMFTTFAAAGSFTRRGPGAQAVIGGVSALAAALLFPVAVPLSGAQACVVPGSSIPLSVAGAPIAMLLGCLCAPAGAFLGRLLPQLRPEHPGGDHVPSGWLAGGIGIQVLLLLAAPV